MYDKKNPELDIWPKNVIASYLDKKDFIYLGRFSDRKVVRVSLQTKFNEAHLHIDTNYHSG